MAEKETLTNPTAFVPEVQEAFAQGAITAGRAEEWIGLPHDQQRQELAAWLGAREAKARGYQRAAQAINDYLRELEGKPVLLEIAQRIQAALTQVT